MSNEYINRAEFERYKRFITMQYQSMFMLIEELKEKVKNIEPLKPIPRGRREMLDKQIDNIFKKLNFLESNFNKMNHGNKNDNKS
jgi:hypothetical protein